MSTEVDKVLDRCQATTSSLDSCLAWLIKAARPVITEWASEIINGSLPLALKEMLIRPIWKKPTTLAIIGPSPMFLTLAR